MKILQVNCVYKTGSTGKMVFDIHSNLLNNNFESIVCYGRGKKVHENNVYKTCSELYSKLNHLVANFTGIMYGHCFISTLKLKKIIKKEKPDIVHLQCINGYFVNIYEIIKWLKNKKIKTVLTLHAEFMYTANCGHSLECKKWITGCNNCPMLKKEIGSYFFDRTNKSWNLMKKSFEGFQNIIVVSVSPWLMERAKLSPFMKNLNHKVVLNGINTKIFNINYDSSLKEKFCKEKEKLIFHATPFFTTNIDHIKGGYYVIELAKKLPEIKFLIAGDYDKKIKFPSNVIMLGKIDNQKLLSKYYSIADLTLLTSKKETFSMVTAESLCCGTPVLGFKAGAPEMIAVKEFSEFVDYGNTEQLIKSVKKMLSRNFNKEEISEVSKRKYSRENMTSEYIKIYKDMMKNI